MKTELEVKTACELFDKYGLEMPEAINAVEKELPEALAWLIVKYRKIQTDRINEKLTNSRKK